MLHPQDGVVALVLLAGSAVGIGVFSSESSRPRSTTVRARGTCRIWSLDKKEYDSLRSRFKEEYSLFQDFFLIVDELQRIENETRQDEWDRSSINLS